MCICYSLSPFSHLKTPEKDLAYSGLTFPHITEKVFSLMVSCLVILHGLACLGWPQYNVLLHSIVTNLMICNPVCKSLDPPLCYLANTQSIEFMHNQIYWYIEVQSDYYYCYKQQLWEKCQMSNYDYNMSVEISCISAVARELLIQYWVSSCEIKIIITL